MAERRLFMLRESLSALLVFSSIVLTEAGAIWAAVPMAVIKSWQDRAPEAVEITVLTANKKSMTRPYNAMRPGGSQTTTYVTLTATVDVVYRTASNLTPGSVILVRYVIQRYKPIPPPDGDYGIILDRQDRAMAYLKKSGESIFDLACDVGCLVKL
jgi:hypothetical protein